MLIKDTGITEMIIYIDEYGQNILYVTNLTSTLTILTARQSYTGYFWVKTPSDTVCNASLTVLTSISRDTEYMHIIMQLCSYMLVKRLVKFIVRNSVIYIPIVQYNF